MSEELVSYGVFAPISAVCQLILMYGFLKVKKMRKHPEILIFWQCMSQILLDVHWITGISQLHNDLSDRGCQILGAFAVYFYYLCWNYILFLSIELIEKLKSPLKCYYKKRMWIFHIISHLSSFLVFITLATVPNNNGNSLVKTCFVQEKSFYELFIMFPLFIHFPICLYKCCFILWHSFNNENAVLLRPHIYVVLAFSITWVPNALAHGLNYSGFDLNPPPALRKVIYI